MPSVKDVLEHCRWLVEKGRADEKAVLVLPRIESQKRRLNKEKKNRIVPSFSASGTFGTRRTC